MDLKQAASMASAKLMSRLCEAIENLVIRNNLTTTQAIQHLIRSFPFESEIMKLLIKEGFQSNAPNLARSLVRDYDFPIIMGQSLATQYSAEVGVEFETVRPDGIDLQNPEEVWGNVKFEKHPDRITAKNLTSHPIKIKGKLQCPSDFSEPGMSKDDDDTVSYFCKKPSGGGF